MGTSYKVVLVGSSAENTRKLQLAIEERLQEINQVFSTWDPGSEISRVNQETGVVTLSEEFSNLLKEALQVSKETEGTFDISVGPLVNLWGFGAKSDGPKEPSQAQIEAVLKQVGWRLLEVKNRELRRLAEGMYLDFSAIAKGYGVDEVARLIRGSGIEDFLVEIGGEIVVQGHNLEGKPWAIGIEAPRESAVRNPTLPERIFLRSGALASSGSYHNYRRGGARHHIIDPRTGRPSSSRLKAVTVYAPSCMRADAVATALMVMGAEEGLSWVESQSDIEALFLSVENDGVLLQSMSSGFQELFKD